MHPAFEIMRPWQWYKNIVVFLALFFSGNLFTVDLLIKAVLAFLGLCLISSGMYIVNDILDLEEDKKHPDKKDRPLPSGRLSLKSAYALSFLLLFAGITILGILGSLPLLLGILLLLNTLIYSLFFKHVAGPDVAVLSVNFLLRTLTGVYAIDVPLSPWIIILPYFLALYLALLKRYGELKRAKVRKVLEVYTPQTLETLAAATVATLLSLYSLYVFSKGYSMIGLLTIPVAAFTLFRWHVVAMKDPLVAEKAHKMLKDVYFICGAVLWIFLLSVDIYLGIT